MLIALLQLNNSYKGKSHLLPLPQPTMLLSFWLVEVGHMLTYIILNLFDCKESHRVSLWPYH